MINMWLNKSLSCKLDGLWCLTNATFNNISVTSISWWSCKKKIQFRFRY